MEKKIKEEHREWKFQVYDLLITQIVLDETNPE